MIDPNFNVVSFNKGEDGYSCVLATGEELKQVTSYVRLYAWENETDDTELIYTTVPNPTADSQALIGFSAADVLDIDSVEDGVITIGGDTYIRSDTANDIELD